MTPSQKLPYDFDLARLEAQLPLNWQLHYFAEIESTNDWALQQFRSQTPSRPAFVLSRLQSRGRGRGERIWQAAAGNLTCSLAFPLSSLKNDPSADSTATPLSQAARLAISSALAVWETATDFLPESRCQIKWPNDLLIDGQKAAGILIESCFGSANETGVARIQTIVIGIGINVNIAPFSEKQSVSLQRALKPISFAAAAGELYDLTEVAAALARRLAECLSHYGAMDDSDHASDQQTMDAKMFEQFNQQLAWRGKFVSIRQGNQEHQGELEGLDQNGYLRLSTSDGPRSFAAGELRLAE